MTSTSTKKHFIACCAITLFRHPQCPIARCQGGTTPRLADGTWDLAAGRRSLEAFIKGLKRRAACAWLLERLYDDVGDLWRSFKATREQVDEMGFFLMGKAS